LANATRSSFAKRQKEIARQTRMTEKRARRQEKAQKGEGTEGEPSTVDPDEDPDIAGIVLGPQPVTEETEDGDGDR